MVRGYIVPDSSLLFDLDTVRRESPQRVERYVDMLSYLAAHDYRVLVPEMVAIECARMTEDGVRVRGGRHPPRIKDFLRQAASGGGDMRIIRAQADEMHKPYARYVSKFHRIAHGPGADPEKTAMVDELNRGDHYGEKACHGIINALLCANAGKELIPIYLLCSDGQGNSDAITQSNGMVHPVNTHGLMRAFVYSGMAERAGWEMRDTPQETLKLHENAIEQYRKAHFSNKKPLPVVNADERQRRRDRLAEDVIEGISPSYMPLLESLTRLNDSLPPLNGRSKPPGNGSAGGWRANLDPVPSSHAERY